MVFFPVLRIGCFGEEKFTAILKFIITLKNSQRDEKTASF
jgi:hypothetical protein